MMSHTGVETIVQSVSRGNDASLQNTLERIDDNDPHGTLWGMGYRYIYQGGANENSLTSSNCVLIVYNSFN